MKREGITAMPLNPESKYPSRRAYVLKMRGDAKPGALAGRLENLVTGRQLEFASGRELLDAIAAELEAGGKEPAKGGER
jgi:hypothetical protein